MNKLAAQMVEWIDLDSDLEVLLNLQSSKFGKSLLNPDIFRELKNWQFNSGFIAEVVEKSWNT